jgi:hypothetical protein
MQLAPNLATPNSNHVRGGTRPLVIVAKIGAHASIVVDTTPQGYVPL